MSNNDVLLQSKNVSKKFCHSLKKSLWYGIKDIGRELLCSRPDSSELRPDEFWALKDISFELRRGECLGLIGHNGAGKSTLLKLLNGLIKPDSGMIRLRGRVGALIELGTGFNPILTGRENIYVNAAVLGLSQKDVSDQFEEIVDFSELTEFIDTPVQNYSSGMKVRLGFAIAIQMKPDILLLDEVLAVGDAAFRAKCFHRIGDILKTSAVVFVSHNMVQVSRLCNEAILLERGNIAFEGQADLAIDKYNALHKGSNDLYTSIIMCPMIKEFTCKLNSFMVSYGEFLSVELSFYSENVIHIGLGLITISTAETRIGQTDFSVLLPHINTDQSHITLEMGPIFLNKGEYFLSITILDLSQKGTIIHAINCASFEVEGPKGHGIAYQLPIRLQKKKGKDAFHPRLISMENS